MRERRVTRADVEHAIRHHHSSWATRTGGIQYEGPSPSGRILKVWLLPPGFVSEETTITVKSVAWKDEGGGS